MEDEQNRQKNLIDTTDSLEAISVFRGWKNFMFVIVVICMLILQACFWMADLGGGKTAAVVQESVQQPATADVNSVTGIPDDIVKTAEEVITASSDANQPIIKKAAKKKLDINIDIDINQLTWIVRVVDFVLIPAAILYCLTMLFCLKISMIGRLGGINHISRAFFLSLVCMVLMLPWQEIFGNTMFGSIYSPGELMQWCQNKVDSSVIYRVLGYIRFCGYWVIVMIILFFSQKRSCRWTRTILRRLEIM